MKQTRSSRAFTLIEMLVAVILIGAFMLVADKLIGGLIRNMREVPAAQNAIASSQSMLVTLRRDVWSAKKVDVASETSATVSCNEGDVTWAIDNGDVVRTGKDGNGQRWAAIGKDLKLASCDSGLSLIPKDSAAMTISSQIMLEQGDHK